MMRILFIAIYLFIWLTNVAQISHSFSFELPNEEISSLSLNPYEDLLAVATADKHIAIFNVKFHEKRVDLFGNGKILKVKFNPAGNLLAAIDEEGNIRVWRTRDWELEAHLASEKILTDFDFHQQEYIIFSSTSDGVILKWAWRDNTLMNIVVDDKALTAVHWVTDFQTLATANIVGDMFLYHSGKNTVEQFFFSDNYPIQSIFSSPQNNFIHFISASGRTNIIVKSSLEYNFYMNLLNVPFCFSADAESEMFLTANHQQIQFYNIYNKQQFFSYECAAGTPVCITFSAYLQLIALAYENGIIELIKYDFSRE